MKVAAVLVGCLVALSSTQRREENTVIDWIMNAFQSCPSCRCGIPRMRYRIVGGVETENLEFPWMAFVMMTDGHLCEGSVINDLYVLTAAHCVYGRSKEAVLVRLHEHDYSVANETNAVIRKVDAIITPSYDPLNDDNDIALLKLNERVDLSKAMKHGHEIFGGNDLPGVRSVCLPPGGTTFDDFRGLVIGWGHTAENGILSHKLLKVTVPILTNAECRMTENGNRITDNMMCAGEPEGRHDACKGDSGGPLHVFNSTTQNYMQVGVVSWGLGCARPNSPGVYSRVNRYLSWIKENTKDACYCS